MPSFNSVAVIGAGAYGTALACAAARAGREITLYARSTEAAAQMQATRTNPKLPGVNLDKDIGITADILAAARADIILLATPAQNLRDAATALAPHLKPTAPVVACAKGIERGTHRFMTEVIAEAMPNARPALPHHGCSRRRDRRRRQERAGDRRRHRRRTKTRRLGACGAHHARLQ
jgi:glycerol-3-phosphate dehydrogenase (NAD(P)+)